jgi:hypothetical protein
MGALSRSVDYLETVIDAAQPKGAVTLLGISQGAATQANVMARGVDHDLRKRPDREYQGYAAVELLRE